jgi:hypothetical protein
VVWEAVVAAAPPNVCLGSKQRKTENKKDKSAHTTCVTLWPKALVLTCSTTVLPALDEG